MSQVIPPERSVRVRIRHGLSSAVCVRSRRNITRRQLCSGTRRRCGAL